MFIGCGEERSRRRTSRTDSKKLGLMAPAVFFILIAYYQKSVMTAIVGILNHKGVAFAADSASTHKAASGTKITNHANKIFALSKFHPVGVAIYNNLALFDVPWEAIIKKCRISLSNNSFDTLEEYAIYFWEYTKKYCVEKFPHIQQAYMDVLVQKYYDEINGYALNDVGGTLTDDNKPYYFTSYLNKLDEYYNSLSPNKAEDFINYSLADFEQYAKDAIDKTLQALLAMPECPQEFRQKFCESVHSLVCHASHVYLDGIYTGLVFFGYGDKDVFPSYRHYRVSYAVDNHLKYTLLKEYKVINGNSAVIAPFAQSDVTNTVIRSVEDDLRKKFYDSFEESIKDFRDEIVKQMTDANAPQDFLDIMTGLDLKKLLEGFKKDMDDHIENKYQNPLMDTVSFLGKEDLADLAESLVRMTCIKRHFSSEDETVGGPVDVAVVTQGDGFIWMKRKHYFDPDLNHQFFER